MIQLYRSEVEIIYKNQIGQQQLVLVEGVSYLNNNRIKFISIILILN